MPLALQIAYRFGNLVERGEPVIVFLVVLPVEPRAGTV